MSDSKPHFEYLLRCSKPSLESFELSRLNHVANLRKELREIVEAWIDAEVEARLARLILEGKPDVNYAQDTISVRPIQPASHSGPRRKLSVRPCLSASRRASNSE